MSQERIAFNMPTVFTIGPEDTDEALKKFATLFLSTSPADLKTKINGIVQGEARVLAGKIKLDDLFNNRQQFKEELVTEINSELSQFGLKVYNANIEELKDLKDNEYFSEMKKKALEAATNQAKIAVAEQRKHGNIGESLHITDTRQQVALYEKNAQLAENDRRKEIAESDANLAIARAEYEKQQKIAEAEAHAQAEQRNAELQAAVEDMKRKQEIERLRASEFTRATVDAEIAIKIAEGRAEAMKREAEGFANAVTIRAKAESIATKLIAEAEFIKTTNEAKGIFALREAEARGLQELTQSAGSIEHLNSYLMIRDGQLGEMVRAQAEGVRDMKPQITVVSGSENGVTSILNQITSAAVPLLSNIEKSLGIDLFKNYRVSTKGS